MGFALIQATAGSLAIIRRYGGKHNGWPRPPGPTASHGSTPSKNHRMAGRKGKRDSGQGLGRVYYEEKG